jgi:hypothetical protein
MTIQGYFYITFSLFFVVATIKGLFLLRDIKRELEFTRTSRNKYE